MNNTRGKRLNPTITTYTGRTFNLLEPDPDDICIEDIAHALSNLCRFTGHVRRFYSVAQHSHVVSRLVPHDIAFMALMHDASEAYISDISTPLKHQLHDYKQIETRIELAINVKFNLGAETETKRLIKQADLIALATERRDLMPRVEEEDEWTPLKDVRPMREALHPVDPDTAKALFMQRAWELM